MSGFGRSSGSMSSRQRREGQHHWLQNHPQTWRTNNSTQILEIFVKGEITSNFQPFVSLIRSNPPDGDSAGCCATDPGRATAGGARGRDLRRRRIRGTDCVGRLRATDGWWRIWWPRGFCVSSGCKEWQVDRTMLHSKRWHYWWVLRLWNVFWGKESMWKHFWPVDAEKLRSSKDLKPMEAPMPTTRQLEAAWSFFVWVWVVPFIVLCTGKSWKIQENCGFPFLSTLLFLWFVSFVIFFPVVLPAQLHPLCWLWLLRQLRPAPIPLLWDESI